MHSSTPSTSTPTLLLTARPAPEAPTLLLSADDVPRELRVSVRTICTWDTAGKVPRPLRVNGRVRAVRWESFMAKAWQNLIPAERIERCILLIRGQKVMLDRDLAEMYGVATKTLNQAVRRNIRRFPEDFMIQLNLDEAKVVSRSQSVTLKRGQNVKYGPLAFTEQGVAMLSSVLRSDRAIDVNIAIMRAFVRLRELLATHKDLARKLNEMEQRYDAQFKVVFDAIRQLMTPPAVAPRRRIGFHARDDEQPTGPVTRARKGSK